MKIEATEDSKNVIIQFLFLNLTIYDRGNKGVENTGY